MTQEATGCEGGSPQPLTSAELSVAAAAAEVPHRLALVGPDGHFSYQGLARAVAAAVRELQKQGLDDPRRPVGLVGANDLRTLVYLYALMELGIPVGLVHPRSPAADRSAWLATCEAGEARPVDVSHGRMASVDSLTPAPPDDERCLAIVRTSGSSGQPKGVILSRRAFVAAAAASARNLGWQEDDRWLLSLPIAHVGGLSVITRCLLSRRTVVVAPPRSFEAARVGEWLWRWRVSLLSLVPTMLRRLLDSPTWSPSPSVRALLLGGAAAPSALLERAVERGVPVLTTWGLTEACSQVTTQPYGTVQRGEQGCGPPLHKMEVRIRGGGIDIRGPQLLSGYLPSGGPSPLDAEGWFATGDVGYLDENGRLHVSGRSDEVIISGGENVHPQEVEAVLLAHPEIEEACVFGVEDAVWGQATVAVLAAPRALPDIQLQSYLEEHLASFQRPRQVAWCEELPKTTTGKIDRRAVKATGLVERCSGGEGASREKGKRDQTP